MDEFVLTDAQYDAMLETLAKLIEKQQPRPRKALHRLCGTQRQQNKNRLLPIKAMGVRS